MMMVMMVGVLTSLLAISQDNHWYICSVNDRLYGDENDRARPTPAVEGN